MSYDLSPRNKKVKEVRVGAFSWPMILQETGAGYILGYGEGRSPASYVYRPDSRGASPVSNDGYRVSALEAAGMAACFRGYVSVNRFINKEWEAMPETEREYNKNYKTHDGKTLYKQGMHEDRLKQMEDIADFFEKSQGFKID